MEASGADMRRLASARTVLEFAIHDGPSNDLDSRGLSRLLAGTRGYVLDVAILRRDVPTWGLRGKHACHQTICIPYSCVTMRRACVLSCAVHVFCRGALCTLDLTPAIYREVMGFDVRVLRTSP